VTVFEAVRKPWYVPPVRGYFMSAEHENAAIGAAVVASKEASAELAKLKIEAQGIGERLERLGQALQTCPENVVFDKESFDGAFTAFCVVDPRDLDSDRVRRLVGVYREQSLKKSKADELVANFKKA